MNFICFPKWSRLQLCLKNYDFFKLLKRNLPFNWQDLRENISDYANYLSVVSENCDQFFSDSTDEIVRLTIVSICLKKYKIFKFLIDNFWKKETIFSIPEIKKSEIFEIEQLFKIVFINREGDYCSVYNLPRNLVSIATILSSPTAAAYLVEKFDGDQKFIQSWEEYKPMNCISKTHYPFACFPSLDFLRLKFLYKFGIQIDPTEEISNFLSRELEISLEKRNSDLIGENLKIKKKIINLLLKIKRKYQTTDLNQNFFLLFSKATDNQIKYFLDLSEIYLKDINISMLEFKRFSTIQLVLNHPNVKYDKSDLVSFFSLLKRRFVKGRLLKIFTKSPRAEKLWGR